MWVDPGGKLIIASKGNVLSICFPTGRIPPEIAKKMTASDLQDAELPISQQAKFVRLRDTLTHGEQLDAEIAIEAMNDDEVAEAVRQIREMGNVGSVSPIRIHFVTHEHDSQILQ